MAYLFDANVDQDKNALAQNGFRPRTTGGASLASVAGASLTNPVAGSAPTPTTAAPQAAGSGNFINFDRIFAANQQGANQMANDVVAGVNSSAQAFDAGARKAEADYAAAIPGGASYTVANDYHGPGGAPASASTATTSYTGPTDLRAFATGEADPYGINAARAQANERMDATKDVYSLEAALQKQHGGQGGYSSGLSTFDAALTNRAGAGRFAKLRERFSNLDNYFVGGQQRVDAQMQNAIGNAQAAGNAEAARQDAERWAWWNAQQNKQTAQDEEVEKKERRRITSHGKDLSNGGKYI